MSSNLAILAEKALLEIFLNLISIGVVKDFMLFIYWYTLDDKENEKEDNINIHRLHLVSVLLTLLIVELSDEGRTNQVRFDIDRLLYFFLIIELFLFDFFFLLCVDNKY